jgi:hypothetical protein
MSSPLQAAAPNNISPDTNRAIVRVRSAGADSTEILFVWRACIIA